MQKVILRAYHFNGTHYGSAASCALAEAIKEEYKTIDVRVAISFCEIDGAKYLLDQPYYEDHYVSDNETAKQKKYNSDPVREIELSIEGLQNFLTN